MFAVKGKPQKYLKIFPDKIRMAYQLLLSYET